MIFSKRLTVDINGMMTGFELLTSGVGSDFSTKEATTDLKLFNTQLLKSLVPTHLFLVFLLKFRARGSGCGTVGRAVEIRGSNPILQNYVK